MNMILVEPGLRYREDSISNKRKLVKYTINKNSCQWQSRTVLPNCTDFENKLISITKVYLSKKCKNVIKRREASNYFKNLT